MVLRRNNVLLPYRGIIIANVKNIAVCYIAAFYLRDDAEAVVDGN